MGIRIKIAENCTTISDTKIHLYLHPSTVLNDYETIQTTILELFYKKMNLSSKFALIIMLHVESFLIKLDAPFTTGISYKSQMNIFSINLRRTDILLKNKNEYWLATVATDLLSTKTLKDEANQTQHLNALKETVITSTVSMISISVKYNLPVLDMTF
ncbi:hypothetical protein T01_6902 [Trichinella spiralis]|uniref:Uncharacterized protein n=1 Tax=Trichinella spiralis TaxID=6334 RepID=A0A0V1BKB7_TRISP|nr:hypothetical protein T01_6902 [Trichinella spiralis]